MDEDRVVWAWSLLDPVNILFIYKENGKESRIDLREYEIGKPMCGRVWVSLKEREVLNQLKIQYG